MTEDRFDFMRDAALRRQLRDGYTSLRFGPDLESAFRAHFSERRLTPGRLTAGLGAAIFAAFSVRALVVVGGPTGSFAFWVETLFIVPLLLAILGLTFIEPLKRHVTALAWIALAGTTAALLTIITYAYARGVDYPYHGLVMIIMAAYFATPMRFYQASAFGFGAMAAYFACALATDRPHSLIIEATLFLASTNILGMMASYAIEYAERQNYLSTEILRSEANRDGLTGLHNRRFLEEQLPRLWQHSERNHTYLGLALLDVDYFKTYNDIYGHLAGDDCLKAIAEALRDQANRPLDMVVRYGGEEFLLVWYDLKAAEMLAELVERARRAVEALQLPHASSAISPYVTISGGAVAAMPGHDRSPEEVLERADAALYEAKTHSRNRVVIADHWLPAHVTPA